MALVFVVMRTCQSELGSEAAAGAPVAAGGEAEVGTGAPPKWMDRLGWIGLALVPAALLTAFTTHVTTDVASAPLLWVLPLSLYLLTFVLVFRDKPLIPREVLLWLHLAAVAVALLALSQTKHETWFLTAATGVAVFFTSAMVAHRTLYEARPAARYLTEFYLWMSFGGALGGSIRGAHRAEDLQRGVRVSAAAGALHGVPAGGLRRRGAAPRRGQHRRAGGAGRVRARAVARG